MRGGPKLIALETRDNWAFSVSVTVGAGSAPYTNTAASAYGAIAGLVVWANAVSRPWHATNTFGWSWVRDAATGGAILTLQSNSSFTLGSGATLLGLGAGTGTAIVGNAPAAGTWAPKGILSITRYYRTLDGEGDASATGAVRHGLPSKALYRPEVEAVATPQDAARLTYVTGKASNPRRGWFYRKDADTWYYLTVGEITRAPVAGALYQISFETFGA